MSYETLLLDLDHTLFDSKTCESLAFQETLREAGVEEPLRYFETYSRINLSLWSAVERQEFTPEEVRVSRFERLVAQTDLEADPESMADIFAAGLGRNGDLYPGAREVLEQLTQTATLALVTNGLSDIQRARVERLELEQYFVAIVISAEIGAAKPGNEIFDATFRALGSPARNTALMVGDSLASDIRGGLDYCIATCWYNPHRKDRDPNVTPSYEITQLEELPAIVTRG